VNHCVVWSAANRAGEQQQHPRHQAQVDVRVLISRHFVQQGKEVIDIRKVIFFLHHHILQQTKKGEKG
jgi:hypothetical protein